MLSKTKIETLAKSQSKKGFIEGASKILLLKNARIQDKKVVCDEFDGEEMVVNKAQEDEESEIQQLMKSIFNLKIKTEGNADFVLKRNDKEARIYLDTASKLDVVVSQFKIFEEQKKKGKLY